MRGVATLVCGIGMRFSKELCQSSKVVAVNGCQILWYMPKRGIARLYVVLVFEASPYSFLEWPYHFAFLSTANDGFSFSMTTLEFVVSCFVDLCSSDWLSS